jgi:uncharacterized membrane protein
MVRAMTGPNAMTTPRKVTIAAIVAVLLGAVILAVVVWRSGAPATPATTASASSSPTASPEMTTAQRDAARQARSYLDASGNSRSGLIEQLRFVGYATEDAAAAVDSLGADWNAQAERSAADYAGLGGFSRPRLIERLEYDGYTAAQAAHGADSVGA